jgi:3-oxoacyl-[acyl-carrier-protein] synthase II
MEQRRVVITGIGAVTPIGIGREAMWEGITSGRPGVDTITRFDASQNRCRVAAEVRDFDPAVYLDPRRARRYDRFSQFSVAAAHLAVTDAGLRLEAEDRERIGVCLGSALGGVGYAEEQYGGFARDGLRGVSPSLALAVFGGAGSCNTAIELGISGPNTANSDSCASGTIAVGNGLAFIRRGWADVMLTGGAEACLMPLCFGAFDLIRAMSKETEYPAQACRPFDRRRDGFVMGEGSAFLVLEELGHALQRDAPIYAEVLGHGLSNDAHHMTAPHPEGRHAVRAMRLALEDARLSPEEIEAVNAHGSSTPLNDKTETLALKQVLGERAHRVPISATKSMHGHSLGAVGAIEAAIAALTIQRGFIPPTLHLHDPDPECDLDYVPHIGREQSVRTVLSNSFGFGGINACLVLGQCEV